MKGRPKAALSVLLSASLAISTLPAPALAQMGEEAMAEEPARRSAVTSAPEQAELTEEAAPTLAVADAYALVSMSEGEDVAEPSLEAQAILGEATTISTSMNTTAALKADGTLWMWGGNEWGQIGDGTTEDRTKPVKVLDGVAAVSLGVSFSAALKTDGTLWTWGNNEMGQLGDGTTTERHKPVKVLDGVASVALGNGFSSAILSDGTFWTWGENRRGQLGDGTTTERHKPTKIMDGVKSASMGTFHGAALKTDGTLWTWGSDHFGQLGDGATTDRTSPAKVMDNVAGVSVSGMNTFIIKADGTLWACGDNEGGQVGDGTTDVRSVPVKILDGVSSVYGCAAIKNDGTLWSWGSNPDEGAVQNLTPAKVMDGVVFVAKGFGHTAVVKTDGSLWMWGENAKGQLGDGTTTTRNEPVRIIYRVATSTPAPARTFPDVPADAWYAGVVPRAAGLGLINGYKDGNFGPADNVTRGQVAVILWNMTGKPAPEGTPKAFPDVASGKYYYDAVRWASSVGVVSGYSNGKFGPDDLVTREQLAVMLANYAGKVVGKDTSGSAADYASMKDASKVSGWAAKSVGWCFKNGIVSGTKDGRVNPQGNATRAETAKMGVFLHDLL